MAEQESGLENTYIGERSVKFLNEDKGKTLYPLHFHYLFGRLGPSLFSRKDIGRILSDQ